MGGYLIALLAGVLTTLSPCVLPLLPIVLLGALQQHRLGPLALAAGMSSAFTGLGVGLSALGLAFAVGGGAVRVTAAAIMMFFGVVLLSGTLQQRIAGAGAPLANGLNALSSRFSPDGLGGQFLLGALLGAVWIPCSGPTLGVAVGLASSSETLGRAAEIMGLFSLGATLPLVALAYASRQALKARQGDLARIGRVGKPILGAVLIVLGLLVASGLDKAIEAGLLKLMPAWLVDLVVRF